ncbi:hypothetical protein [Parabacteroides chongii]|uniref:hypothetical protein n=1 Tax=Parabacteroides chongii TaxID=2685834 RepID=UPI00240DEAD2|nr:hypothetical protein [Parabacteroides chongii]WFE83160.1 hypothetical protein P3L47_13495 [Parabacteroides chongii]
MKRFLLKLFYFLFPLGLLAFTVDYCMTDTLEKSDFPRFRRWYELTRQINADILITGSSRASFHVDPYILDSILRKNTFNIGISGGPYEISEVAYRIYKKHNHKKIELILCNVDFLWFGNYAFPCSKVDYAPFYHDPSFKTIVETMNLSPTEKYIPAVRYGGQTDLLKKAFGIGIKWEDELIARKAVWKKGAFLVDEVNKPLSLMSSSMSFQRGEERIKRFTYFLDECKDDSVQVVLFKSPIHPSAYKKLINIESSFLLIDSIAEVYRLNVLDYTDYLIEDTSCFFDPVHLNYKGAELFSTRLAHDVDSLLK